MFLLLLRIKRTFYPTVLLNLRSNRAPLLSCVMYIPYVTYVSTSLTYQTHILSYCAAEFAVQSCPTLVMCDVYTVRNLCFYFSYVSNAR